MTIVIGILGILIIILVIMLIETKKELCQCDKEFKLMAKDYRKLKNIN